MKNVPMTEARQEVEMVIREQYGEVTFAPTARAAAPYRKGRTMSTTQQAVDSAKVAAQIAQGKLVEHWNSKRSVWEKYYCAWSRALDRLAEAKRARVADPYANDPATRERRVCNLLGMSPTM